MEQSHEQEIEQIISLTACPKGFACHRSTFEVLCKAKDIGVDSFLVCLEKEPFECSLPYGCSYYSRCPLRVYVGKNFGR